MDLVKYKRGITLSRVNSSSRLSHGVLLLSLHGRLSSSRKKFSLEESQKDNLMKQSKEQEQK